ncbi:M48 family metalloprotease [Sphingomonas sp.]|uniref:M48 family metalloprotease n=1 Tax=Sphingomonas sp. TaxID=28214 RepID=UPI00286A6C96|nr:M48 family metalloprotease [Sphingomonas sp.]
MRKSIMLLTAAAVLATPALAQLRTLRQSDVAEAAKQHEQVVAEFGGAMTGPRAAYVDNVGRRVSAYSGTANAGQVYHFTTLNSAVENAFSVAGGYVYITRQLMGLMGDEAELAFVLGHETGHVAADHSRTRQKSAQRSQIIGVLGAILGGVVGNNAVGNLIGQGIQQYGQLATLKFSRAQEYQADQLGIGYIAQAGYDPLAGATMLDALTRSSALEARVQGKTGRSTPEWASTHPLSENRSVQAKQLAQATGRVGRGLRNRDAFLAQLDGVLVDDDPAQGVIEGTSFTHPDLRLRFDVPVGFQMQNGTDAVTIAGSSGKAQFGGGRYNGDLQAYVGQVLQGLTGGEQQVQMGPLQRTQVNGIPAVVTTGRAQTDSGVVDVSIFAYEWSPTSAYHFIMLTQGGQGIGPFQQMVGSLRRITPAEAAAVRPRVIDVATVRAGDTLQSLAGRMAYRDYRLERFLSLNNLSTSSRLVPGTKVKLIVYGTRR